MPIDLLKNLGLPEKTAKIYIASLSLGVASVQAIANKAMIKRPTAYLYIEELMRDGFLEKIPLGRKDYYRAREPQFLEKKAEEQLQNIKTAMPDLLRLQNEIAGKPDISVLEGKRALEQIYKEMTESASIRFWSDLSSFEVNFHETFNHISEKIREKEIRCREIIADRPDAKLSSKRYAATAGRTYSSRIANKEGLKNDSAIYGDTVALFRIQEQNLFVILIKESTIASTIRALFDMAWESATPFIGR